MIGSIFQQKERIYTSWKGKIQLWHPKTNVYDDVCVKYHFPERINFITEISNQHIVVGHGDNQIKIININNGQIENIFVHDDSKNCQVLPDGRIVSVGCEYLRIWNLIN